MSLPPLRIVMLDNHDSFTWNLVQGLAGLGATVDVVHAHRAAVEELVARTPDGVVVSPGPGAPHSGAPCVEAWRALRGKGIPALGVCLGHQSLAVAFGGRIARAARPRHGRAIAVRHDGQGIFAGLPDPLEAMLYHSLTAEEASLPSELTVSARGPEGEVMGLRHRSEPLDGVQFHPESIGTPDGRTLLAGFLRACAASRCRATPAGAAA